MSKQELRSGKDRVLEASTVKRMEFLCSEYELIKTKKHSRFCFVTEFYDFHQLTRQNFIKFYNRYKASGLSSDLLPQKRGAKYKTRRTLPHIEQQVIDLRKKGLNRFEIHMDLHLSEGETRPCPSTIYAISKKHELHQLKPKMKEEKRKIIKEKAGELGHMDCHYLPKGMVAGDNKRYFLVGLIDHKTSLAWCEVISDITSLNVMFSTMKLLNLFKKEFGFDFEAILTDNGAEFGSGSKNPETIQKNPFMRLLAELKIKHRRTKPYRPQTNGKIERFWKTIEEDLLHEMVFESLEHLKNEVFEYMVYYNYARPHQAANGKTPSHMIGKNIT
jgi:hypothetical protein